MPTCSCSWRTLLRSATPAPVINARLVRPARSEPGLSEAPGSVVAISAEGLLAGLNPAQFEAVTRGEGPLLSVAGADSRKTRVLTHLIAHLIDEHQVSPFQVLAITFTDKAAHEMRARIGRLVGPVVQKMRISTFHSA